MVHNRIFVIVAALSLGSASAVAQQGEATPGRAEWTLAECIDRALERNISIKQSRNRRMQQDVQLNTDKWSRLPSVDASAGQNFSFGRGLTEDNTYTNTNTSSTSFSVGASVPLFTGMRITNSIKLGRLNLEAATADLEKAGNDVRVQVAQAYVQALYDMEVVGVACRQVAIDSMQVERLRAMKSHGKASPADLSQQEATLAQSRLTATQAKGNRSLSLLALSQLLELQSAEGFAIALPDTAGMEARCSSLPAADAVYAEALGIMPEVKAEQIRLKGADYSVKVAQAAFYPQLSLTAGLGTNYYRTSGYSSSSFASQMRNNFSQYVGLSLSIPIFNRMSTRNSVRNAELSYENQQLQVENVKKSLYKEIQQAYYNAVASQTKYVSSMESAESARKHYELTEEKYRNGKADIADYNDAKNSWLSAESDSVRSKYECLFQTRLLDFYKGEDIAF